MVVRVRTPIPNADVIAARRRRITKVSGRAVRFEWLIEEVSTTIVLTMRQRVAFATHFLKDQVVRNISISVIKGKGPRGGRVITGRSRPGEFPRADTKQLMKTIFEDIREVFPGTFDGYVATPLDYGLILETRMNRSFLVRSYNELLTDIRRILTGPIR